MKAVLTCTVGAPLELENIRVDGNISKETFPASAVHALKCVARCINSMHLIGGTGYLWRRSHLRRSGVPSNGTSRLIEVPPETSDLLVSDCRIEQFMDSMDQATPLEAPVTLAKEDPCMHFGMRIEIPSQQADDQNKVMKALDAKLLTDKSSIARVYTHSIAGSLTLMFVRKAARLPKSPCQNHTDYCKALLSRSFGVRKSAAVWLQCTTNGNEAITHDAWAKMQMGMELAWSRDVVDAPAQPAEVPTPGVEATVGSIAGEQDATQLYEPHVRGEEDGAELATQPGATAFDAETYPGIPGRPCKKSRTLDISPGVQLSPEQYNMSQLVFLEEDCPEDSLDGERNEVETQEMHRLRAQKGQMFECTQGSQQASQGF